MTETGYHYQFRLILIGDSTVGKSSLLYHFKGKEDIADLSLTVGVDFHAKVINLEGQQIKLQLWDTAGQERFRAIIQSYFRNAVGGLLVFDITNRLSFEHLDGWLEEAKEGSSEHSIVFVLVGNKCDLEEKREVSEEEGLQYAQKHGMDYIETSACSGNNVERAFNILAKLVHSMVEGGCVHSDRGTWDGVKRGQAHDISSSFCLNSYETANTSVINSITSERSNDTVLSGAPVLPSKGRCCAKS